jgi:hypothetical protein
VDGLDLEAARRLERLGEEAPRLAEVDGLEPLGEAELAQFLDERASSVLHGPPPRRRKRRVCISAAAALV